MTTDVSGRWGQALTGTKGYFDAYTTGAIAQAKYKPWVVTAWADCCEEPNPTKPDEFAWLRNRVEEMLWKPA